MRFNLEIGPGDYRLAQVTFFGRLADVLLWTGEPLQATESRYRVQFDETWAATSELEKAHTALRIVVADALANGFDPDLITLVVEDGNPRWHGRILSLANSQQ